MTEKQIEALSLMSGIDGKYTTDIDGIHYTLEVSCWGWGIHAQTPQGWTLYTGEQQHRPYLYPNEPIGIADIPTLRLLFSKWKIDNRANSLEVDSIFGLEPSN